MATNLPARPSIIEEEQRIRSALLLYTALGVLSADATLFSHLGPIGFVGLPSLTMFLFLTMMLTYRVVHGRFSKAFTFVAIVAPLLQGAVLVAVTVELLERIGF